jgi:hypothetical protein
MIEIEENILLCGVVKNAAKYLDKSIRLCIQTGELFNNHKIIIYENNSTDDTKHILSRYTSNPNFKIIMEDIPYDDIKRNSKVWAYTQITGSDHPCRIEQIANTRNKILAECKKPEYDEYTYIMFIDLDTEGWSVDGIIDSFRRKDEWDAIFANGLQGNRYYDLFAYRDFRDYVFSAELLGDYSFSLHHNISIPPNDPELKCVVSAFGGIGIYKKTLFSDDIKYSCIVTEQIIAYYTRLLCNTKNIDENLLKIIEEPCPKFPGGYATSYIKDNEKYTIYWKNNSGYDNVVVCEHVSVNVALFMKEYRLRINPKMIYLWSG